MTKRVFHIISHFDLGGAERVAINIAKSKNKDFEYHVIEVAHGNSSFTPVLINELEAGSVIYHRSPITNKKLAIGLFPFWFIGLFLKERPSVIHTHTEVPDLSVFLFYRVFAIFAHKVKIVRTIHNTQLWNEWKWIGRIVEKFYQRQDANVAISLSAMNSYQTNYGKVCPVIYNGIECPKERPFTNISNNRINIIFAGRLEPQKGIDTLIAVIQQLKSNSRLFFHIVGNGSLAPILKKGLNGIDNVCLYDSMPNLSSYLSSFDYLFMPSVYEGLGILSIEAGMSRVPSIINDCAGLNETLPEDWPLKVHDNSVGEYCHILTHIEEFDKVALGNIAHDYAQKFSITNMQSQYEELYNQ